MDENELVLFALKGMIGDMPKEDQERIKDMAERIETIVKSDSFGVVALAIIAAKYQK